MRDLLSGAKPPQSTPAAFDPASLAAFDGVVCGVDEVGRGPLAGPVVAAAVILPPDHGIDGIGDSKTITKRKRNALYDAITESANIGIGYANVAEIDALNIHQASLLAMQRAVFRLGAVPDLAVIDGRACPDLPCRAESVIKGDARVACIGAASIIAKVTRDRLMADLHRDYPAYGWDRNAGYGTREHCAALDVWGATPHHRASFARVRAILTGDAGPDRDPDGAR